MQDCTPRSIACRSLSRGSLFTFICLTIASAAPAESEEPFSVGDHETGSLTLNLYRGGAVPFELTVIATPNNCQGNLTLRLSWSKKLNRVQVRLTGEPGSLERFPDVDRTEGVDYFPIPWWPQDEDIVDGRYQLWIISAAGPPTTFYYQPPSLDFVGSEFDFEQPPAAAIPVPFPTLYMFATPLFQPKQDGSVDLRWSFPYDGATRGDRPEFSHHIVTFPPPNLCGANPNRLDLSTLRPYISNPLPAADARPWSDYLRGGLLFDVTVEPAQYTVEPPLTNLTATYSGGTAVGGTIPRGWTLDIDAAFMSVAPPIRQWPGAGECENHFAGVHTKNLNFCQ